MTQWNDIMGSMVVIAIQPMNLSSSYQLYSTCLIVIQMINTALLANRRSIARLRLHLLEEDLQKESVLRLRWQDISKTWKAGRVQQEIERFRYVSRLVAVLRNAQKNSLYIPRFR